jgi:flavin reductase (DIM6/NTAB) family NADH-FMN oxidoreductase RutF
MTDLTHTFAPGPETARDFRQALGRFVTGVTVVTTQSEIGPLGITANSFASVSLDPALVLWSPAKASRRYAAFAEAEHYAIHVLAKDQKALCKDFTRDGTAAFDALDWAACPRGVPLIAGALARFECTRTATHDAGDHGIVVGQVTRASWRDGLPLVFSQGAFGCFTESD